MSVFVHLLGMFTNSDHSENMNKLSVIMDDKVNITIAKDAIAAFCNATEIKGKYAKGYFVIDQFQQELKLKLITIAQGVDKVTIGILKQKDDIEECIIAASHIYPKQARLLKQFNIPFIDIAGNAFINKLPLFVYVEGQNKNITEEKTKPVRAFKKTGLKIIFAFLCNPGLENRNYRDIAGNAGVALGAVGRVMTELEKMGFLRKKGRKGFQLVRKDDLLKRWVTAYPEQLKPSLIIGRYMFPDLRAYAQNRIKKTDIFWGGEMAAEILTDHLIAKNAVIYTDDDITELALRLRLQKNGEGNTVILKRFWNFENKNNQHTVPPVLVYADLLATGLERNIETAGKIYENKIKKFFV